VITSADVIVRFARTRRLWPLVGRQQRELFALSIHNTHLLTFFHTRAPPMKGDKADKLFVAVFVSSDEHMKVLCVLAIVCSKQRSRVQVSFFKAAFFRLVS